MEREVDERRPKLSPRVSLAFNGQCEEAFRMYERSMNGTIAFMLTWGDSAMAKDAPPGWGAKIYHATLKVGDTEITGGDVAPDQYRRPQGFSISLNLNDVAAADRIFAALSENGSVQMPLQETFWAGRFGAVVDRFGIPWIINCEKAASGST